MGFFGDLESGLSYLSPGTALLKDSIDRTGGPAGPPSTADDLSRWLYTGNRGTFKPEAKGLAESIFGANDPQGYKGVVEQGYQNLGQALGDQNGPDSIARTRVATELTQRLASTFADQILAKSGSLPSEDQIRQFVSQTLTPGLATQFIQGTLNPDKIVGIIRDYFVGNPDALVNPGVQSTQQSAEERRLSGLKDQLDKIYNAGRENLVSGYDTQVYGPAKQRAVNDLSSQGILTNPNSRYTLNAIEANRGRDISTGLNTLEGQRAAGNVDLSTTIENLLQKNADRSQNAYQFGKNFNFNQENTAFNQGLQRQQLDLADQLGRLQAGQGGNGLSRALGGGLSGAAGGSAFGPWGTAIGGGLGALVGYLGSKG